MTAYSSATPDGMLPPISPRSASAKRASLQVESHDGSREAFWRERAEQLQRALDSRVAIEQAKGILSERFALSVDRAFDVLRDAARSTRVSIHEVARSVVTGPDTPDAITWALARKRDTSGAASRRRT